MKYFIAIVPPEPVLSMAQKLKNEMKERFNSRQALYSPPHITLHMPFEWNETKEERLEKAFLKRLKHFQKFQVHLKGFGAFPPRVIFLKPDLSQELKDIHHAVGIAARLDLHLLNQDRYSLPFHPHMTLAFRDLKRDQFNLAWPEFKERKFDETFQCDRIVIMRREGLFWIQHIEIGF